MAQFKKDIPPEIDFRYDFNISTIFQPGSIEYDLLEELQEEDWISYLDELAACGVTVEYDSVDDCFRVIGFQAHEDGIESVDDYYDYIDYENLDVDTEWDIDEED